MFASRFKTKGCYFLHSPLKLIIDTQADECKFESLVYKASYGDPTVIMEVSNDIKCAVPCYSVVLQILVYLSLK